MDGIPGLTPPSEAVVSTEREPTSLVAAVGPVEAQPVVQGFEPVPEAPEQSIGADLMERLEALEQLALRVAAVERAIAPFAVLVPGLSAIVPIANELASLVENLSRGRIAVR